MTWAEIRDAAGAQIEAEAFGRAYLSIVALLSEQCVSERNNPLIARYVPQIRGFSLRIFHLYAS